MIPDFLSGIFFCANVMKRLLFFHPILLLMILSFMAKSQEIFQPSSRSQAMAEVFVPLSDSWSVFGNQAGMAETNQIVVGGSFQNRFLISEFSARTGFVVLPVQSSVFAISYYQFGKIPFREEKIGLAYARKISPNLNFGFQFNDYRLFLAEENKSASTIGLELGFQYHFNSKLLVGLHLCNPYKTKIQLYSESFKYPSTLALGLFYAPSETFGFACEVDNNFGQTVRIKSGFEYCIFDQLFVRAGISGKPYLVSGGVGFCVGKLTIDLASSYHQYLGNSPSVSLQYHFKK